MGNFNYNVELHGTYAGVVEANDDPEGICRLKVRVPMVYGPFAGNSQNQIPTNDLPWALPIGLPAGGSEESGGFLWIPRKGDQVWVRFLDGEPEKPLWEWAMQNLTQHKGYNFQQYKKQIKDAVDGTLKAVVAPDASRMTRYGHTIEINPTGIVLFTKDGNYLIFDKNNHQILLNAKKNFKSTIGRQWQATAQSLDFVIKKSAAIECGEDYSLKSRDEMHVNSGDYIHSAGSYTLQVGGATVFINEGAITLLSKPNGDGGSSDAITMDGQGHISIVAQGNQINLGDKTIDIATPNSRVTLQENQVTVDATNCVVNASSISLGVGESQTEFEPLVKVYKLIEQLNTRILQTNTHVHPFVDSNGDSGLTSIPLVPQTPYLAQDIGSETTSAV